MHVSSLPGPRGIGEIGPGAFRFIDWASAAGLSVWQFLPTGPTGYGDSPYQPLSVFAGNPLFIDLDDLADLGLLRRDELEAFPDLPAEVVDYTALTPLKLDLVDRAAQRFHAVASPELAAGFNAFVAADDRAWLNDYAVFSVLRARHAGAAWTDWERPYALKDPAALAALEASASAEIESAKVVQYLFERQWNAMRRYAHARGVALFGDVPIYMALDCAEAWARPDLLELDASGLPTSVAGVPPDYFAAEGQCWGSPLYRWDAHAAAGFDWWLNRLAHAFRLTDLVRLDHFRGFEAYWAIPAGAASARDGHWRPGPRGRLFDAIVARLGAVEIVAEDLGMITDEVRALRRAYGLPGMQVLQFLVDQDTFDIGEIAADCVCYTGTHDNDTTVGWFRGSEGTVTGDALLAMQHNILSNTSGRADTIHLDMIGVAIASRAKLAMAPMQDFLGLDSSARMNTPGTPSGNWQWRLRADQLDDDGAADLRRRLGEAGRIPHD